MVGPDAAIDYLRAMERGTADDTLTVDEGVAQWPPHSFVTTIDELLANVMSTPDGHVLRAERIDNDGDAVVTATRRPWQHVSADEPRFWVRASLLADLAAVADGLRRAADVATEIGRLNSAS
jgi:hypothetical protein